MPPRFRPVVPTTARLKYGLPYSNDMGPGEDGTKSDFGEPLRAAKAKTGAAPKKVAAPPPGADDGSGVRGEAQPPLAWLENDTVIGRVRAADQATLVRRYTEHAITFMRQRRERPFFLYLAHNAVHFPRYASEPFRGQSPNGLLGDWVKEVDWSVGEVLNALRELKQTIKRRTTMKHTLALLTALLLAPLASLHAAVAVPSAPNVLFIVIDDMNDWTTLFDKNNPIHTPNLERLAARGMFFSHAYCVVPACNPSRAAVLTGYRPETTRCFDNGGQSDWYKTRPDAVTLPQYFRNNGYMAKGAGKVFHHGVEGRGDDPRGTEHSWDDFQKWTSTNSAHLNGYTKEVGDALANAGYDWGEIGNEVVQGDEKMFDYVAARMGEKWDQPMFLAAGIFKPHLPFYASKDFFKRYPLDKMVMPPMPANDLDDMPEAGRKMAGREGFIYKNTTTYQPPDTRSLQRMVQCYQASASYADSLVGRLLDKLDASKRADNTIIVLWADNGYHLGDKTSCVKFTLWEKGTHIPFIIVAPGVTKPGSRCETPVSLLDIYPTLLELAGLPPKADNEGYSLMRLLKNPQTEWKHPAIMTMGPDNKAVRTLQWRYIRYSDGSEELYDEDKDPWEWANLAWGTLAKKLENAAVLTQLRLLLPPLGQPDAALKKFVDPKAFDDSTTEWK